MEAEGNGQIQSEWSTSNDDALIYSATSSNNGSTFTTTDVTNQYSSSPSHGLLPTFATVHLSDGPFHLTTGGGAFPSIYMAPMQTNFEREVVYQTTSGGCPLSDDLSQGQNISDSKQYISVPFVMSNLQQSQTQQPSNSVSFSIPSSCSVGFRYGGLLQGLRGVGIGPGNSLGLTMAEGMMLSSQDTITNQDLDANGALTTVMSAANTSSMLRMLSSTYPQSSLSIPTQSTLIVQPPLSAEPNNGSVLLEMVLPQQQHTTKFANDNEVGERQEALVYRMDCSSDDGEDLEQLLGHKDYCNANQPDDNNGQMRLTKDDDGLQSGQLSVRKSERLALRESTPSPVQKAVYISKPYNTYELWCDDCLTSYVGECPKHKLHLVFDKVVQSRAWASLPSVLQIFRLRGTSDDVPAELGVFAKRCIPKRNQFGPFLANLVSNPESLTSKHFLLVIESENGIHYLDAVDEHSCNWMMFVRPASNYTEQNLVTYQFGTDIYFSTTKNIEPRQELKVWYAPHYAERLGLPCHHPSDCDQKAIDEQELNWPCYECNEKFRSSAQLQKHLANHDEPNNDVTAEHNNDDSGVTKRSQTKSRKRYSRNSRKQGGSSKEIKKIDNENSANETGSSSFQSWKKRKTRLYLNRMKKYKVPIKRSIRVLHKRLARDLVQNNGADEFACMHCDLSFEGQVMLNLHTLTHAAEDAGFGESLENMDTLGQIKDDHEMINLDTEPPFQCPLCQTLFAEKTDLFKHAGEHATVRNSSLVNPTKPYKCTRCWKAFTVQERLQRHMLCHGDDNMKPMQCQVCKKRFMNNSALACHMKTHSDKKYYQCPICNKGFDQVHVLRLHAEKHIIAGVYQCAECHRTFDEYIGIRNHMRAFHSEKTFPCSECGKIFPRSDKLRLHRLRHSAHREFMCETCGRQFKRKDKLREHTKRMHNPLRPVNPNVRETKMTNLAKFTPKVSPFDYQRFIYKCHDCLLGFKRRGMLVNHLAKRHPEQPVDSVPELNLPILRSQRDYFCQYCEKVYKSSSKRKVHILKNHPGAELPASARRKEFADCPGLPNPTFSAPVGNVTTVPHPCEYCHKQYASKAKLFQHQRKKHNKPMANSKSNPRCGTMMTIESDVIGEQIDLSDQKVITTAMISRCVAGDGSEIQILQQPTSIELTETDLLTQAMTELNQSFGEYRVAGQPGAEFQTVVPCIINTSTGTATAALVQTMAGSTVEFSQLGQHFAQLQAMQTTVGMGNQQQIIQAVPMSLASTLLQRTWNNSNNFQTFLNGNEN